MKLFYRISDKSYEKPKLLGATKEVCFRNFSKIFPLENTTVIADRCAEETINMIGVPVVQTDYGNAGSLFHALKLAKQLPNEELVYFVEDDYLHLDKARVVLEEGLRRYDYVTLYDHPDKYTRLYDGGEISKVIKTNSSHWRQTTSTCMTFATSVGTLKKDFDIWAEFTDGPHPYDHEIFLKLGQVNKRRLAVCIPGLACHTDLTVSNQFHWNFMEPWAVDLMIAEFDNQNKSLLKAIEKKIGGAKALEWYLLEANLTENKSGMEKLLALDCVRQKLLTQG